MTDPESPTGEPTAPESDPAPEPEPAAPPGQVDDAPTDPAAEPDASTPDPPDQPARPQPPAMTPAQIDQQRVAMVRVACDGRCGQPRDLYAGDQLPTGPDGEPYGDVRAVLMTAAGCADDPRRCPGAVGTSHEADTFNAVTTTGVDLTALDLPQMIYRVRGGDRGPDLQPALADSGVQPVPLLTVDDLEQAANGDVRLPIATTPFEPPPHPMMGALGVDPAALDPILTGGPISVTLESEKPPDGAAEPSSNPEG